MLARVLSYGLNGIMGYPVEIEADINNGLPSFEMVGLPDAAVKESKERVRSATKNSGYLFPNAKITVNMAPADTKKEGSFYDLAIAVGILSATEQLDYKAVKDIIFLGELSLNGEVRQLNGILPVLISAYQNGFKRVVIPKHNYNEARYVNGLEIFAVENLRELVGFLKGNVPLMPVEHKDIIENLQNIKYQSDFKYVMGQYSAKRALEIAATGGHNILMLGPPGAGKTMLARCVPSIMPDMTAEEALEVTKIHSIAGMLDPNDGIVATRPFRTPHHTASRIALTGGGAKARPGEISLAHNGVLFLDELPEYSRATLEILRQPLEDGIIVISRALRVVEYPANFMLIASMNPCPCGNYGVTDQTCKCSPGMIMKYVGRLSGPLMDRIDLHIEVENVKYDDLRSQNLAEPSEDIRARVNAARKIQNERFKEDGIYSNAQMSPALTNKYCVLNAECEQLLKRAFNKLRLSARAHSRILKVARTIADLDNCKDIKISHLSEAIQYRSVDRKYT